jgi:uncharacterized protein YbjT (DUF2867 family)
MNVLITGATGFLGQHLARALVAAGHQVIAAARDPAQVPKGLAHRVVPADFTRDLSAHDWLPRLVGVDVVVNTVGVLREAGEQSFERLHLRAPQALFEASVHAGVRRVVQISALGADAGARSAYHLSKKAADDFLMRLPLAPVVVQPSLVYGPGGASAHLFNLLASLPLIPLPGRGEPQVQPIHIDDAVQAIVALVQAHDTRRQRVPLVGPSPLSLRDFLGELRGALGLAPTRFVSVPWPLMLEGARIAERLPGSLLDVETLQMLQRGNTGPAAATRLLLGRAPRPVAQFVEPAHRESARQSARLSWALPLLRLSLALVWIVTGLLSIGLYPVADSLALLARVGLHGLAAEVALYGAAALDLALGVATLAMRRHRRWLWWAQIGLMGGYMLIISLWLPEFWLHPFGPILKNLPMLGALAVLLALEPPARRRPHPREA